MEVRGGCGYIEEWSDPRLLRDAHLGSIWEGTSNIVALDVLRAIRREGALPVLQEHVGRLLAAGVPVSPGLAAAQSQALERAFDFARRAAQGGRDHLARQAASALYHAVTLAGMRREAAQPGLALRAWLADLVLAHRLGPRDPLADDDGAHDDPRCAALLALGDTP
jgi:hypothetical protein